MQSSKNKFVCVGILFMIYKVYIVLNELIFSLCQFFKSSSFFRKIIKMHKATTYSYRMYSFFKQFPP